MRRSGRRGSGCSGCEEDKGSHGVHGEPRSIAEKNQMRFARSAISTSVALRGSPRTPCEPLHCRQPHSLRMFRSLLIANRGEIACRIARTAHRMGITPIAVYSQADASALHVKSAERAILLGPAPA